jgi:hypothetical protein
MRFQATLAVAVGSAAVAVAAPAVRGGVDYARDVAPLLARACADCHGGVRPRGGLRLDQPAALATVIHRGDSGDSELVRRLLGVGGDTRMPAGRPALPKADIALIRRWIDAGAPGLPTATALAPSEARSAHWAYRAPARATPPAVRDARWPRNDIDRFVLARLEREGLTPAPEADGATLVRRVTLDLTGLPPTPAEVDAYLADRSGGADAAYERLVDRLLASPHFGERWAVPWLDAARYADSNGYEKDATRSMWRYRDWVVEALNADMPFDRFTLEQVAGDLLPGATVAQRIATGFHRNTMLNEEGGVDPEEARFERLCDRATTTATVWLGSTIGCARCHDHKHDPFSQRDFYGLLAFFEDGREATLPLPTPAQARRLEALRAERQRLERTLATWTPALGEAQRRWEADLQALPARFPALAITEVASRAGAQLARQADGTVLVTGAPAADDLETVIASTPLARVTAVRLEALPDAQLPGGGPGRGPDGAFFLNGIDVAAAPASGADADWTPIAVATVVADDTPREEPERYAAANLLPRPPTEAEALDMDVARGWGVSPAYDKPARLPRQLVLVPTRPFGFGGGTRLRVRLRYDAAAQGEVIGRFRLSAADVDGPGAIAALSARLLQVVRTPEAARARADGDALAQAFRQLTPLLARERARLDELGKEEDALGVASTLVMTPPPAGGRRPPEARLRERGAFASPGEAVAAAVPAVLAANEPSAPRDRLALGRWLASDANPLAARVTVNRIWAQYFGRGLVETSEDFGSQGAAPTHPELLDWLATQLPRAGWRQKALHRLIVMSATYRQASVLGPAARRRLDARDPENRLLGRAPRRRLDAEMVRDVTLAASGLLEGRVGGPPVFPPEPSGVWSPPNSHEGPWRTSAAPDRYRRALYTFWRRTAPYPTAALFDAPSRERCTVRRERTSTPLQALATLNDPAFWEAAQALARRMQTEPPPTATVEARIEHGFRLCTARGARRSELAPLRALHERTRANAGDDVAWSLVANVLLNLDETLTNH